VWPGSGSPLPAGHQGEPEGNACPSSTSRSIQYAVEEAAAAGITDMLHHRPNSAPIEDHFDKAYELETELALRNKTALLEAVQAATPPGSQLHLIRQTEALGLASVCVRARGQRRAFRCCWPMTSSTRRAVIRQMMDVATHENAAAIGVMEVPGADIGSLEWSKRFPEPVGDRIGRSRASWKSEARSHPLDACRRRTHVLTPGIFRTCAKWRPARRVRSS